MVSSVMKQGRKKAGHNEPDAQVHDGQGAGGEASDTPRGIEGVRLLQLITGREVLNGCHGHRSPWITSLAGT
jgi:hypothetical protein